MYEKENYCAYVRRNSSYFISFYFMIFDHILFETEIWIKNDKSIEINNNNFHVQPSKIKSNNKISVNKVTSIQMGLLLNELNRNTRC